MTSDEAFALDDVPVGLEQRSAPKRLRRYWPAFGLSVAAGVTVVWNIFLAWSLGQLIGVL
jgi:hypothetical protein